MARRVRLHGGPGHGSVVAVGDGKTHFHIIQPVPEASLEGRDATEDTSLEVVPTREGMYSQVRGSQDDFEWDGWRTHE